MRYSLVVSLGIAIVSVAGCGGGSYETAPVSGTVKLNGKPLPNALVFFTPITRGEETAGPTSSGKTNAKGEFTLQSAKGEEGAVVGKHRVMITTVIDDVGGSDEDDSYKGKSKELVPPKYNSLTELTFEVPSGGSTNADFDLKR